MADKYRAINDLKHIPAFAGFILKHKLRDFVNIQYAISRELELPILKFYSHLSEEALAEYGMKAATSFLNYLADNKGEQLLEEALSGWKDDKLDFVSKDQVETDDLLLISYIRKQAFTNLLPAYTDDCRLIVDVVNELDHFFVAFDLKTANTYVGLLKQRISEDSYFKEKITDISPGFYYIYDIQKRKQVEQVSKLFSYLGYCENEYSEEDFFIKLMHPDDKDRANTYFKELKNNNNGEMSFFEYRLLTSDQQYKWMRNYETIYKRDINNSPTQLIGIAFDISKEYAIRNDLQFREMELLEAQELANMGSYTWDLNGGKTFRTAQIDKILGLNENDTLDELMERIHPADRGMVRNNIDAALKGDGEFEAEYRCIVKGVEKIVWGKGKVSFEEGKAVSMKGTVMDVTDKHHMLQKLQRSESLYKQAEMLNKLGNWTWEIKTDKLEWSDELFRIYGLEPQSEKVNFERFLSFIHPADKAERLTKLQEQMTHTRLVDYHFRIIAADGAEKILYGQSRVLMDEQGIPFKFIGTCQDVTKQKELENTLYQKTLELERSNASLSDFAFISSHDLKEPLRKIAIFGDKLRILQHGNLKPESVLSINKIVDAANRLQKMVDELLTLSQISSDQRFENCSLDEILKNALVFLEEEIKAVNAAIKYELLPVWHLNRVQFQQLFTNLLSNALKFRKKDCELKIRITHRYLAGEEVKSLNLDHLKKYLRIDFADNGIGFDKALQEKVFTMFQRLHGNKYTGTGIGLAICKKIVEHHNGVLLTEAEEGKGATFIIIIPELK